MVGRIIIGPAAGFVQGQVDVSHHHSRRTIRWIVEINIAQVCKCTSSFCCPLKE